MLDIVIPIIKEDLNTLKKSYPYIIKNLPVKKIVLIGPPDIKSSIEDMKLVEFIDENNLIPGMNIAHIKDIMFSLIKTRQRAGWYFQQFIKMAYCKICPDDYYLVWDSDTVPLKTISFFDSEGKPFLAYRDFVKYDSCFFTTQRKLLPGNFLDKSFDVSFICEHLLVKTQVMKELIYDIEENNIFNKKNFYEVILYTIPKDLLLLSGFSEFEVYSAYVLKKYPDLYRLRYWKNLRNGRTYIGDIIPEDIIKWIANYFDVISIEKFNNQWLICKLLLYTNIYKYIKFKYIYTLINPLYKISYDLRFKFRSFYRALEYTFRNK